MTSRLLLVLFASAYAQTAECEEVAGWNVACDYGCTGSGVHLDGSESYSVADCASMCTGNCTAFKWFNSTLWGCYIYDEPVFREEGLPTWTFSTACAQKPDLEDICSSDSPDAGEGWTVECGQVCLIDSQHVGSDHIWQAGVTMEECKNMCDARSSDCNAFHYNPQNGGSCQLLVGTITGTMTPGDWVFDHWLEGACVYRGVIPEPVMETYYVITELGTCGEITTCPGYSRYLDYGNVSLSLGTCAGHNYSNTCEGSVSSTFLQLGTPFYYNCKENMIDLSESEENKYAMVYYFSDDYDCMLGDLTNTMSPSNQPTKTPTLNPTADPTSGTGYGHECVGYNAVDSDFDEIRHMSTGSVAECASSCTGDCTAFYWDSGCAFYTGAVMRQLVQSNQDSKGCFQRVPDLEEICSWSSDAPNAGEGWIVDCGKLCRVSDSRTGPARLEWDAPWRLGVTIKECGDLCNAAGDCDGFHFNPQNGGSCQLLPGFIVGTELDSIPSYIGGACVHKGFRENIQDSGSSALRLSIFALTMLLFLA